MLRVRAVVVLSVVAACAGTPKKEPNKTPAVSSASAAAPPPSAPSAPPPTPLTPVAEATEHAGHHGAVVAEPKPWTLEGLASGAKLLPDLGKVQRTVSTKVPEAQAYFNQGLALTWGFNHDEAARSYAKAAALDPSCALCFWGAAYTMGPNYNIPMLPDRARAAWDAITKAQALAAGAQPVEQALIAALAKRYKGPEYVEPPAMQPFNQAYAHEMQQVAKLYPGDLDVLTLTAEALMNLNPWKLWQLDGKPAAGTPEIVSLLERVLKKDPEHAGANHYYIHAVEASKKPDRAVPSADRLGKLVPGAGHIVHMPAHIYQRVGRYEDAAAANRKAIEVDRSYLSQITPPGYYPFYLSHNYGFLAFAASMEGRSEESLAAAKEAAGAMPRDIVCGMPGMDFFLAEPLLVAVRFGRWDELLTTPAPDAKYQTLLALHHHAQGMALAAQAKLAEAKARVVLIREIAAALPAEQAANLNIGRDVVEVAASVLEARIAELEKRADAIALWERAVSLQDKLKYSEPADWFYPTRHYLGAALLDLGKAKEAERVYREDLKRNPNNGWALFGLWKALEAQNKKAPAEDAKKNFERAWARADVTLTRSAF